MTAGTATAPPVRDATSSRAGRVYTDRAQAVAQARTLIPSLRARAMQADKDREVSTQSIAELREAGLFRLMAPAKFGGSQLGIAALVDVVAEIAAGCGSTGWVYGVLAGHNWILSLFPAEAQREIFGDPDSLVASIVHLKATPRRDEGGFVIENAYGKFCSGISHANWVMVGAGVASVSGPPEARYFLIPKSEIEVIDDWYTAGLRATGSYSLKIKKTFVPAYRSAAIADMARGTAPGVAYHNVPLYRAPFPQVLPFPLAGVPLGIARAALNVYLEFYRAKLATFSLEQIAEQSAVFSRLSDAHADVEAAAALILSNAEEIDAMVDGGKASPLDRARFVRNISYGGHKCRMAVASLFEASGGSAIYDSFELQRIWRDVNAATAHNSFVRDKAAPAFGRAMLGLPPSNFDRIGH